MLCLAPQASAHTQRLPSGETIGLPFESASHGELIILRRYSAAINELAHRSIRADLKFRRLLNYAAIENSYCLWGLAPRAAEDEQSPFNECTHAHLSALKALLLHMRTVPDVRVDAETLISRIDAEAVASGAAFIGCAFTGEQFTTAEFVTPHWELLPTHVPTLTFVGLALVPVLAGVGIRLYGSVKRS